MMPKLCFEPGENFNADQSADAAAITGEDLLRPRLAHPGEDGIHAGVIPGVIPGVIHGEAPQVVARERVSIH
jgi:hypothetical protein